MPLQMFLEWCTTKYIPNSRIKRLPISIRLGYVFERGCILLYITPEMGVMVLSYGWCGVLLYTTPAVGKTIHLSLWNCCICCGQDTVTTYLDSCFVSVQIKRFTCRRSTGDCIHCHLYINTLYISNHHPVNMCR